MLTRTISNCSYQTAPFSEFKPSNKSQLNILKRYIIFGCVVVLTFNLGTLQHILNSFQHVFHACKRLLVFSPIFPFQKKEKVFGPRFENDIYCFYVLLFADL